MNLSRRTELIINISNTDISADINKYFINAVYTEHSEDKADDLRLELDDRDSHWISWLTGMKGAIISCVIVQRNWNGDGGVSRLDCGQFEIDSISFNGPPSRVSIKATSLPHGSTVRTEIKTKAWENIKLSAIAGEIASLNGLEFMFESDFDLVYDRREQIQTSDVVFLQDLCYSAGISLKVTDNKIVMFDAGKYEAMPPVYVISSENSDIKSWRFATSLKDASYSSCHVSYTEPQTGETFDSRVESGSAESSGQVLEINEKVGSQDEARQLAENRLRQKNKNEFQAEFTLCENVQLVAGVTVDLVGWGFFDGRYIIETTIRNISGSGGTLQVKLRRTIDN